MRLDIYLTEKKLAKSRETAQRLIREGSVSIGGRVVTKPSFSLDESAPPEIVVSGGLKYVSRGGLKLEAALDRFGLDVTGLDAVDIGASTGGFTDCLLQRGAERVRCIDVGRAQLDKRLAEDPRVTSFESMNARYLTPEQIGGSCELAVCDVSFISLTLIVHAVRSILAPDGKFVALIKPQFEAGRAALDKHGIVKERAYHVGAIESVLGAADAEGLYCEGLTVSPIEGGDGNREYLALFGESGGFDRALIKQIVYN